MAQLTKGGAEPESRTGRGEGGGVWNPKKKSWTRAPNGRLNGRQARCHHYCRAVVIVVIVAIAAAAVEVGTVGVMWLGYCRARCALWLWRLVGKRKRKPIEWGRTCAREVDNSRAASELISVLIYYSRGKWYVCGWCNG